MRTTRNTLRKCVCETERERERERDAITTWKPTRKWENNNHIEMREMGSNMAR
jgi:hypothetical protein